VLLAIGTLLGITKETIATTIDFESEGFFGPSTFGAAGPAKTINVLVPADNPVNIDGTSRSIGNVTFRGGVILSNETNLPADHTSLYATTNNAGFGPGTSNPITINFPTPVTGFSVDLLNGQGATTSYSVSNNINSTVVTLPSNTASGHAVVSLAGAGTSVNVTATSGSRFDFSIDNISFTPLFSFGISLDSPSLTGQPTFIRALATPNNGLTLTAAAQQLGYLGFDWVQHITNYPGLGILTFDGLAKAPPTFNDPAPSGYLYCPIRGKGYSCDNWPFYYNPDLSLPSSDPWALSSAIIKTDFSESLSFVDSPQDPFIIFEPFASMAFTTELVGIVHCNTPGINQCSEFGLAPSAPLYTFNWTDNYTGPFGGISITMNDSPADPGGTGGITLVSVNGVPVPEPSTITLLMSGLLGLAFARCGRRYLRRTRRAVLLAATGRNAI
jgi:hypothetical protein